MTITTTRGPQAEDFGVGGLLYLFIIATAPLSGLVSKFTGIPRISEGLLLIGILLFVSKRFRAVVPTITGSVLTWPALVICAWLFAGALAGGQPMRAVLQSASFGVLVIAATAWSAHESRVAPLAWKILAAWTIVDGILLMLGISGIDSLAWDAGSGRYRTIISPVGALASNAAFCVGYFAAAGVLRMNVYALAGVLLCGFIVVHDSSRTATLSTLLVLLLTIYATRVRAGRATRKTSRLVPAAAGLVLVVGVVFILRGSDRITSQVMLLRAGEGAENLDLVRILGYRRGLEELIAHPLLGRGLGSVRDPIFDQVIHNTYLQLAADLGAPSSIAYVVLLGGAFAVAWRRARMLLREGDTEGARIPMAAASVALVLGVKALFHPLGLVFSDWQYVITSAPAFALTMPSNPRRDPS